jgi:hypothetical protein
MPVNLALYTEVGDALKCISRELENLTGGSAPALPRWRVFAHIWISGLCSRKNARQAWEEVQAEWQCSRAGGPSPLLAEAAAHCAAASIGVMNGDERAASTTLVRVRDLVARARTPLVEAQGDSPGTRVRAATGRVLR